MITRLDGGRAKKLLPFQPLRRHSIFDTRGVGKNNSPVVNIKRGPPSNLHAFKAVEQAKARLSQI